MTTDTARFLQSFDASLRRRGRAAGTRRQYALALDTFARWIGGGSPADLTMADIEQFLFDWEAAFRRRRGREPSACATRNVITALRVFFAYLEQADVLVDAGGRPRRNPARGLDAPRLRQRPNDHLQPAEDRALLRSPCGERDRLIVWTLRYTGVRVGEACALRLSDVELAAGEEAITVRAGKTDASTRSVPLLPPLIPLVSHQVDRAAGSRAVRDRPLLATEAGSPLTSNYVWRVVKRVASDAGVRRIQCTCATTRQDRHGEGCPRSRSGANRSSVTPHTLRRTFGTDLLNRGVRLETVSKLLGHASTTITERAYAELRSTTIRRELLAVFQ